jgi:hypothetical protein
VSPIRAGKWLVALSLWLSACGGICENTIISELSSPGTGKKSVVFERSCGATTGFSTHVSVLNTGEALPQSAGNAFDADSDHGAVKEMNVTVRWAAPDQLVIRYPARARVFKNESRANGVAVAYEAEP